MEFSSLRDNLAVDLNPQTVESYSDVLSYLGYVAQEDMYALYGQYLVVTPAGPEILSPVQFHRTWEFFVPDRASRTELRAIIPR